MRGNGFLAVWSDVEAAYETDYLHWLTREHTEERLGVDGFLAVRVFRAPAPGPGTARFLIVYELESAAVVASPPYLARLDAPTAWTRRIMPLLRNFVRGGGSRVASHGLSSHGKGRGGYAAALQLAEALPGGGETLAQGIAGMDRIAAVHVLATDRAKTTIPTNEKRLRAEDRSFNGLLLIEGLDRAAVEAALKKLPPGLPLVDPAAAQSIYACVFALDGSGVAGA
jgi:hypothetical protein